MAPAPLPPRLPDWRPRLAAYIVSAARRRFRPGRHDCALFVAGALAEMTGHDPGRDWRGGYASLRRGRRMLADAGFADHVALAAALLEEIPPSLAHVGDVAVVREGEGLALGIVQGAAIYVVGPQGLGLVDRLRAERAFRV